MIKRYLIFLTALILLFVPCLFAQDNIIDTEEELSEILKKDGIHEVVLIGIFTGPKISTKDRKTSTIVSKRIIEPSAVLKKEHRGTLTIGSETVRFLWTKSNEKIDIVKYNSKNIKIKAKLRTTWSLWSQFIPPYIESVEEIQEYIKKP
ncbi:MAG: hypothetical protein KKC11_00435 [Candidatus Omnitrophica bacterium]|nr:hypothetical protein [Candidatus Omnitrophota bacterium]MBU0879121.1 hypothetical protein [Candidatus Omnitrophota bacterium]